MAHVKHINDKTRKAWLESEKEKANKKKADEKGKGAK